MACMQPTAAYAPQSPVRWPSLDSDPASPPFMPLPDCCAPPPASRPLTLRQRAPVSATRFPTQTPRTCCCLMTCWESPTRTLLYRPSIRVLVGGRLTALVNAASLARETTAIYVVEDASRSADLCDRCTALVTELSVPQDPHDRPVAVTSPNSAGREVDERSRVRQHVNKPTVGLIIDW
jgi:hypothetical protein